MKNKTKNKGLQEEIVDSDKVVGTAFFLMFPALLTAIIAAFSSPHLGVRALVVALAVYQFLLLKKFIQEYYKR